MTTGLELIPPCGSEVEGGVKPVEIADVRIRNSVPSLGSATAAHHTAGAADGTPPECAAAAAPVGQWRSSPPLNNENPLVPE